MRRVPPGCAHELTSPRPFIFSSGSTHSRFKFAKDAIELRKQGIVRGQGAEETVVLAFGGSSTQSTGVLVTRKLRRRQLWKVNS